MAKRRTIQNTEPATDHLLESTDLDWDIHKCISWYRCNPTSRKKEKQWVLDYVKHIRGKTEVKSYSYADSNDYSFISSYCRVLSKLPKDIKLPAGLSKCVYKHLEAIKSKTLQKLSTRKEKQEESVSAPSIQERMAEQVSEYVDDLGLHIDEFLEDIVKKNKNKFTIESWLRRNQVKSVQARMIAKWYEQRLPEIVEAISGSCDQLNEAYGFLTKPQKKKYYQFLQSIVNGCMEVANTSTRKKRRKKVKTPEQQVAKVNYEKENKEYGIQSISPTEILGASKLVVFNTKYRQLTYYQTLDPSGFHIKGTTVANFSKDSSKTKTLRKPKDILSQKITGVRLFNNVWKSIKAKEKTPNGRLNKNTVILKVYR